MNDAARQAEFLRLITTRRVVREFQDVPLDEADLLYVLTAGRWATRGSNSRIHRFLVIQNRALIRRVRAFSPGMLGTPAALVVICTDGALASAAEVQLDRDLTPWIDVGTAAMNMMLAAHSAGLGSCPVTSFSKGAVSAVLKLPPKVNPEFMLQLGHPRSALPKPTRPISRDALNGLVFWEVYPG